MESTLFPPQPARRIALAGWGLNFDWEFLSYQSIASTRLLLPLPPAGTDYKSR